MVVDFWIFVDDSRHPFQVNDVFQSLNAPADAPVPWEFRHTIFRRGDPDSISRIKRRSVKSNNAQREQQAQAAAVAAHAASLSRYGMPGVMYEPRPRPESGHYARYSTSAIPMQRPSPYPPQPQYLRRPPPPPPGWGDDSARRLSDVVYYPAPPGEGRPIHQPVPPHMRPHPSSSVRHPPADVSPVQRQGAFEYGPYVSSQRRTPEHQHVEMQVEHEAPPVAPMTLGVRAHDMLRDSEELCDRLTDVFSGVEGMRVATANVLDKVITQFGDSLSTAERKCRRR